MNNDRRKAPKTSDKDLYKTSNIKDFIEKERRKDELDRLREVTEQKKTWNITVAICGLINLALIGLAVSGVVWP